MGGRVLKEGKKAGHVIVSYYYHYFFSYFFFLFYLCFNYL